MKFIYITLILFVLSSCQTENTEKPNEEIESEPIDTTHTDDTFTADTINENISEEASEEKQLNKPDDLVFNKKSTRGLLLGEHILLLDEQFNVIQDISEMSESYVYITAMSDKMYKANPDDDYCDSFYYVNIKTDDLEGIIEGRYFYSADANFDFSKPNEELILSKTSNFAMGIADDEGLTGCGVYTPAFIKTNNYEGLILNTSTDSKYATTDHFQLLDDDMGSDKIDSIVGNNGYYKMYITTSLQEGFYKFEIAIKVDSTGAEANVLKEGPIEF